MNKLINAIPEERILEELNYIFDETINAFVYNEKYRTHMIMTKEELKELL